MSVCWGAEIAAWSFHNKVELQTSVVYFIGDSVLMWLVFFLIREVHHSYNWSAADTKGGLHQYDVGPVNH